MKLRIRRERAEYFYYPDCMVCCGPSDQTRTYRENPVVLGEVLSPSTERTDRIEKFDAYTSIASLQEYVLLAQDQQRLEIYRRINAWRREIVAGAPGSTIRLDSIGFEMPLASLYRRVSL